MHSTSLVTTVGVVVPPGPGLSPPPPEEFTTVVANKGLEEAMFSAPGTHIYPVRMRSRGRVISLSVSLSKQFEQ